CELAVEHDVAVENGACGVGDRVLLVVAFGQYGIEGSDRASVFFGAVAGAFHQLRNLGKHRGRVAARNWGLANRQCQFALGLCEASERIHQQQYIEAAVAEIFGNGRGAPGAVQAHQWRIVGGGGDDNRFAEVFGAKYVFNEFAHFAATFADQTHDDDVGFGETCHLAEQHALADAGAGEQADTLAAADREQRIDRAYANVERLADRHARKGIDRRADHACAVRALDVAALVDRVAAAVDDAAEQFMTHRHFRVTRLRYHARAGIESLDTTDRHQ